MINVVSTSTAPPAIPTCRAPALLPTPWPRRLSPLRRPPPPRRSRPPAPACRPALRQQPPKAAAGTAALPPSCCVRWDRTQRSPCQLSSCSQRDRQPHSAAARYRCTSSWRPAVQGARLWDPPLSRPPTCYPHRLPVGRRPHPTAARHLCPAESRPSPCPACQKAWPAWACLRAPPQPWRQRQRRLWRPLPLQMGLKWCLCLRAPLPALCMKHPPLTSMPAGEAVQQLRPLLRRRCRRRRHCSCPSARQRCAAAPLLVWMRPWLQR